MMSALQPVAQRCPCPQPEHLGELVQSQGWSEEMPLLDHMDICCNWLKKIVWDFPWEQQWNWVFNRSMETPALQTRGLFQQLVYNNQCEAFLDLFPSGPVQDSFTGLLLKASIRYSLGDLVLQLTQKESVSDTDLMDAIKFAVHLQNKTIFLKLVRDCPRSRSVFKQQFAQQYGITLNLEQKEGKVEWIYETLYQGGLKDLALYVAVTASATHLIVEFCFDETGQCDSTQKRGPLRKLYIKNQFDALVEQSHSLPDSDAPALSILFRKAITASVDFDCVDSFVGLLMLRHTFSQHLTTESAERDVRFAYTLGVQKRPHFISAVIQRMTDAQWPVLQNEIRMLFHIVMEHEVWGVLPAIVSFVNNVEPDADLKGLFNPKKTDSGEFPNLLEKLVCKMLSEQSTWPHLAPVLEMLLKERAVLFVKRETKRVKKILERKCRPLRLCNLKQWCVKNGHGCLALFLAVVTLDWKMVNKVVTTSFITLRLHPTTFWTVLQMVIDDMMLFSAGIALLKNFPVTAELLYSSQHQEFCFDTCNHIMLRLARECEFRGLFEWAAVLLPHAFIVYYGHDILKHCQTTVVLNYILKRICSKRRKHFDIVRTLIPRCTDPEVLKDCLKDAVTSGQFDLAGALIGRVDPSTCVYLGNKTLLFLAVSSDCSDDTKLKMVRLCVAAGLPTFQRDVRMDLNNCPLLRAIDRGHDDIVHLLIDSGAYSPQSLENIKQVKPNKEQSTGFGKACQAAATPFRLEHMARVAVSYRVGCQPGRAERIKSLGMARDLEDKVNFKDVFLLESERNEKEVVNSEEH